ncbi:MAG: hypothetical protein M3R38_03890 [Actinomycetota bacterium]|nr:hypothetical protein [Actinomycetota bacterium]
MSDNPNPSADNGSVTGETVIDGNGTESTIVPGTVTQESKAFAQQDVNKLVGNARKEARQVAEREVREQLERRYAEELGVPLEEAKGILQQAREAEEARKSDLEKAQGKLTKAEQRAETAESRAGELEVALESLRKEYALRDALRDAGINGERLPLALKVADLDAEVGEAVRAIQEASPEWFSGPRPSTSPDATRRERPVPGIWDMPKDQFEELQARAARGEKVTLPPMR